MQISSKDFIFLIGLISVIFLIAPITLILYVTLYNKRKRRYKEEKEMLAKNFEHELLKSQMEVQEQTLQTIASNLHDNIGQLLSLTVVTLSSIRLNEPERIAEKVASAETLAKRSIKELRALSRLLHGEELISMGLAKAIAFELTYLETAGLHTINFENNYASRNNKPEREIILFRIFQEILNNIVKHAEATLINVVIDQSTESLILTIIDNGKGFDVSEINTAKKGMGLYNINKRVQIIQGTLSIKSSLQTGTEVVIKVPYQE